MTHRSQAVHSEVEFDMRCDTYTEDGREFIGDVEMNEFTLFGKGWSEADLYDWFLARHGDIVQARVQSSAVWAFMEAQGDKNSDADSWENVW